MFTKKWLLQVTKLTLAIFLSGCIASLSMVAGVNAAEPTSSVQTHREELDNSFYNPDQDLLSLHYDMLFDADDIQAVVAAKMMLDYYGIDAMVVAGTKSHKQTIWNPDNSDTGLPSATTVLDVTFPGGACSRPFSTGDCGLVKEKGWVNAGDHWDNNENAPVVGEVATIWGETLSAGGKVYIAEGGLGDFTVDVANWLINGLGYDRNVVKNNIISVQHSNWNMEQSGLGTNNGYNSVYGTESQWRREPRADYTPGNHFENDGDGALQNTITHWRINDGNGPYGNHSTTNTPDAENFWAIAKRGNYSDEWSVAQFWGSKRGRVDFSDTVELVYILGVHDDIEDFNPNQVSWVNFIQKFNNAGSRDNNDNSTPLTRAEAEWVDLWGSNTSPVFTRGQTLLESSALSVLASELRFCFKNDSGPIEVFEINAFSNGQGVPITITKATGWSNVNQVIDGLNAGETAAATDRATHNGNGFQCIEVSSNDGPKPISFVSINHDDAGSWHVSEAYVQYKRDKSSFGSNESTSNESASNESASNESASNESASNENTSTIKPWADLWGSQTLPIFTRDRTSAKSSSFSIDASELRFCFKNDSGPIEVFEINALAGSQTLPLTITKATGWSNVNQVIDGLNAGETTATDRASHNGKGFQCIEASISDRANSVSNVSINHDASGTWRAEHVYVQYR